MSEILEYDNRHILEPSIVADGLPHRMPYHGHLDEAEDCDFGVFVESELAEDTNSLYADAVAWMERRLLVRVLSETNGNKSKACQILGITRGSLRHKVAQLGIAIHQTVSVQDVGA